MAGTYTVSLANHQGLSTEELLTVIPADGKKYVLRWVILVNNLSVVQTVILQLRTPAGAFNVVGRGLTVGESYHQDIRLATEAGDELWGSSSSNAWQILVTAYAFPAS